MGTLHGGWGNFIVLHAPGWKSFKGLEEEEWGWGVGGGWVGGGVLISIQGAGVETFDWLTRGMGVVQTCTRGLEIIALYWAGRDRVCVCGGGGGGGEREILLLERDMEISHRFAWNSRDQFASVTLMMPYRQELVTRLL